MTGTPLDLTPFGPLLKSAGYLYWVIAFALTGFALWVPGRWWAKGPIAALILAAFVYPVLTRKEEQKQQHDVAKAKLGAAMAHFEMRCKGAGEKIVRTVENVEGVVWMKWRDKALPSDDADQFKLFDPFGRDCTEQGCIEQLLRVTSGAEKNPEEAKRRKTGYRFAETIDPADQKRYRSVGVVELPWTQDQIERHKKETGQSPPAFSHSFAVKRTLIDAYTARYGVTWDDISTREDREHWIAGGSIKVIDLHTNEVIAERVGYMMDRGLGSTAGFRSPWGAAPETACPSFPKSEGGGAFRSNRGQSFIFKVVKPTE